MDIKNESVLVCITAQCNSTRLIDRAFEVAEKNEGELHILHVQRGDSIFNNSETPKLLEELFNYGSEKGGMIHFYCDEDVSECIGRFAKEMKITKIVFGEPPTEAGDEENITERLKGIMKFVPKEVELIIIPKKDTEENISIKRK